MSTKDFTANVISATKVVPDGNFKDSKASGIWDINEALDLIKGGNWPNAANINPAAFVDGLFSTFVYNGTGNTSLAIDNGLDLTKGGLVWTKERTNNGGGHILFSTDASGNHSGLLVSSSTAAAGTGYQPDYFTFRNNGYTTTNSVGDSKVDGREYVSWTFRKQPKFFDIVTYTGNGSAGKTVAHNLGSVPGMIMVKVTSTSDSWALYHRGSNGGTNPEDYMLRLNTNDSQANNADYWNDTAPTDSIFTLGTDPGVNGNGQTYVAYLFAHHNNDGGFGEPKDQDIIKCGSVTADGSGNFTESLGFEPQFILFKAANQAEGWEIFDGMRNLTAVRFYNTGIEADSTAAEGSGSKNLQINADGFASTGGVSANIIYTYMAIRRGGMQTPTAASDVFSIDTIGSGAPYFDSNHIVDMALVKSAGASGDWYNYARPIGEKYLATNTTAAEASASEAGFDFMDGHIDANWGGTDAHSWMWKRARGYFDVVAYKGTGTAGLTVNHNLGVAPEMTWVKRRDAATNWRVNVAALGTDGQDSPSLRLNLNNASEDDNGSYFGNNNSGGYAAPTSSVLTLGGHGDVNTSGGSYIAYLFATVAGVSKVGSYTANGNAQNIDCGFSGGNGARFVLIKRTDAGGHWFQFDTSRGFVTGDDLNLQLNETNAEESGYDHIDPLEAGFTVAAYGDDSPYVNINGATYLFYAIA